MTGKELREIRAELGLTQAEMAKILFCCTLTVRRYEMDPSKKSSLQIQPNRAELARIALRKKRGIGWENSAFAD